MSEGFTPGPWAYTPTVSLSDRPDLPCVVDEFRLVVAQCWDDGHTEDECEANARLIAAAPELLEALELVAKRCGPRSQDGAIARAAIAKARGIELSNKEGNNVR